MGVLYVCLIVGPACSPEPAQPAAEPAVVLPDLSRLAPPVRQQIRDQFGSFTRVVDNPSASPNERAAAYGSLGRLLLAAKLGDPAERCYLHAQTLAPDDMRWPYMLGHVYLLSGDRIRAGPAFERALALRPNHAPALIWLAETRLDDGRLEDAESLFLKAGSAQPSAAALFGAGRAALARRAYAQAAERFERALALEATATAIHYPLAMSYRALGDQAKADVHLRRRGESWPTIADPLRDGDGDLIASVTMYERRGVEALRAQDWRAAIDTFRQGLEFAPDDTSLRHRLGTALYAAGDEAGAVREFEEVLRRDSDHVKAHISLGLIDNLNGRFKEAGNRFSAALRADGSSPEARLGLAEALRVSGQPAASLQHYQRAIDIDPARPEAWAGGAMALISLRRTEDARDWLARARRVHPEQPKLRELEGMLPR